MSIGEGREIFLNGANELEQTPAYQSAENLRNRALALRAAYKKRQEAGQAIAHLIGGLTDDMEVAQSVEDTVRRVAPPMQAEANDSMRQDASQLHDILGHLLRIISAPTLRGGTVTDREDMIKESIQSSDEVVEAAVQIVEYVALDANEVDGDIQAAVPIARDIGYTM